jgi:hypothetical protein
VFLDAGRSVRPISEGTMDGTDTQKSTPAGAAGAVPRAWALVAMGCALGLGLTAGGFFVGQGLAKMRTADRVVTVKGVAEIEAQADLATLPVNFAVQAGEVKDGMAKLDETGRIVLAYLVEKGFKPEEIALQRVDVLDTFLLPAERPEARKPQTRYRLTQYASIRSTDIQRVTDVARDLGELARRGVVLDNTPGATYILTSEKLNELKSGLIRAATERARNAAAEFAEASGSRVGAIKRANQGVISVSARDEGPFEAEHQAAAKRVRAVTTVDYTLIE